MTIRPDIPVIMCTGFSGTMSSKKSMEDGFAAYLLKPIESRALLSTIRQIFDTPEGKT